MDIPALQRQLQQFADEREWQPFHSPKNLAIALSVEAAELLERFQWLTEEASYQVTGSDKELRAVREEMADVMIYLLRLADILGVDLEQAVQDKMRLNAEKYPVELAKGNAVKYNRRE
jgi:NTP pyrophosphatase (non-canonical NTP hydrolase)